MAGPVWEFPSQVPKDVPGFRQAVIDRLRHLTEYLRRRDRYPLLSGAVSTTDATTTTALTIPVALNRTVLIEAAVVGRRTGGTAGTTGDGCAYLLRIGAKNIAGTASVIDAAVTLTAEDQAGFDATATASGSDILIQVTGAVDNAMTWAVRATVMTA